MLSLCLLLPPLLAPPMLLLPPACTVACHHNSRALVGKPFKIMPFSHVCKIPCACNAAPLIMTYEAVPWQNYLSQTIGW
jgi:hypothetical protein